MRIRGRSEAGFTALEVLVAAVLLAIGLVVSAQLMVVAMTQGHLAKQGSDASTLAAETIEQYRDAKSAFFFNTMTHLEHALHQRGFGFRLMFTAADGNVPKEALDI